MTNLETIKIKALFKSLVNIEVVDEYQFFKGRKWRFDFAIPNKKIAIEIEGGVYTNGRHTRPKGYLGDMEKYNAATMCGWKLLRFTPQQMFSKDITPYKLVELLYKSM